VVSGSTHDHAATTAFIEAFGSSYLQ